MSSPRRSVRIQSRIKKENESFASDYYEQESRCGATCTSKSALNRSTHPARQNVAASTHHKKYICDDNGKLHSMTLRPRPHTIREPTTPGILSFTINNGPRKRSRAELQLEPSKRPRIRAASNNKDIRGNRELLALENFELEEESLFSQSEDSESTSPSILSSALFELDTLSSTSLDSIESSPSSSFLTAYALDDIDHSVDAGSAKVEATLQAIEQKGALSHTVVHGVFIGPARSGKNCLMDNLLDRCPSLKSPSTGVADAVVRLQVEKLNTVATMVGKGSKWSTIDYNDEVLRLIGIVHSDSKNVNNYEHQDELTHKHRISSTDHPHPVGNNTPFDILTDAIENKGLDALQKYFETSWSLYLSNTGGQIEFQEVLPLLVSGPCVFFYTFRLDRSLDEHYTIEYELQDGTRSVSYTSTLTTVEGIQQSLASIAAMGIFVYQGREKRKVHLRPKVFFVGTHRDRLRGKSAEITIAKKDQYLQESTHQFKDIIEFASSSQMIFTVDNFSENKSDFQQIRSAVESVVERHEFEMVCPSHWLILSFALRRIK